MLAATERAAERRGCQAALQAGCTTLYSEDSSAGARFDDLLVVNPFATQAHEPAAKTIRSRR